MIESPLDANPPPPPESLDPARERMLLLTLAGIQFAHILDFMIMICLLYTSPSPRD